MVILVEIFHEIFSETLSAIFPSLCLLIRIQSDVWRALKRDGACFSFKRSYPSLEIFRSFISFTYLDKVHGYRDCFFFYNWLSVIALGRNLS